MELQKPESVQPSSSRRKLAFSESTPADKVQMPETIALPPKGPSSKEKNGKKPYGQMILDAITDNDPKRKGLSFAMIQKFIKGKYLMEGEIKFYVKKAYEKLMEKKIVEHVTGSGFSGSIRLSKEHLENMRKKEKAAAAKATSEQKKKVPAKKDKKSDKNNNKKEAKPKGKSKDAAKVNPKKTAITKTKIERSDGKVRLSITAMPMAQVKMTKAKAVSKGPKASKGKAGTKKSVKVSESKSSNTKKPTTKKAKAE